MKKLYALVLACAVFCGLAGCAPSSSAPPSSPPDDTQTVHYENTALGFAFDLPGLFEGHLEVTEQTEEIAGETVNVLNIAYKDEENNATIYVVQEMSTELCDQMMSEEGPKPVELGRSDSGRAVVYYPPQSNPFPEDTDAYTVLQTLPDQATVLPDTFAFLAG